MRKAIQTKAADHLRAPVNCVGFENRFYGGDLESKAIAMMRGVDVIHVQLGMATAYIFKPYRSPPVCESIAVSEMTTTRIGEDAIVLLYDGSCHWNGAVPDAINGALPMSTA